MALTTSFSHVNPAPIGSPCTFYGTRLKKRTEQAWRVVIDNKWAFRPAFARQKDAQAAASALAAAGINDTASVVQAGWEKCQRIMFEALPW